MNKEESDLIIAEQNKSTEEILKAIAKVKSDYKELCNLKDMRITELEKENAELKKENQKWKDGIALKDEEIGCIETDFNTFKSKAKEIIREYMRFEPMIGTCSFYSEEYEKTKAKAEQFLKDCEVEK